MVKNIVVKMQRQSNAICLDCSSFKTPLINIDHINRADTDQFFSRKMKFSHNPPLPAR